jgi:hypothetical protein
MVLKDVPVRAPYPLRAAWVGLSSEGIHIRTLATKRIRYVIQQEFEKKSKKIIEKYEKNRVRHK